MTKKTTADTEAVVIREFRCCYKCRKYYWPRRRGTTSHRVHFCYPRMKDSCCDRCSASDRWINRRSLLWGNKGWQPADFQVYVCTVTNSLCDTSRVAKYNAIETIPSWFYFCYGLLLLVLAHFGVASDPDNFRSTEFHGKITAMPKLHDTTRAITNETKQTSRGHSLVFHEIHRPATVDAE